MVFISTQKLDQKTEGELYFFGKSLRKMQRGGLRGSSPLETAVAVAVVLTVCFLGMMVEQVSATRWIVGKDMGWTTGVNYTVWAEDKHFYIGDWLFFDYDRTTKNVLEVNETDYEACNSGDPLHDWSTGHGRDVVPLNVSRPYYFISYNGFCYGGMKLAIQVENLPPPPAPSPVDQKSSGRTQNPSHLVLPVALAVGVIWRAFPWLW